MNKPLDRLAVVMMLFLVFTGVAYAEDGPVRFASVYLHGALADLSPDVTSGMANPIVFTSVADGTWAPRAVGVRSDGTMHRILRLDGGDFPRYVRVEVLAVDGGAFPNAFVHDSGGTAGSATRLDHPAINGNPNALLLVTPHATESATGPVAVTFSPMNGQWFIQTEDQSAIAGRKFNVLVLDPRNGPGIESVVYAGTMSLTPGRAGMRRHEAPIGLFDSGLGVFTTRRAGLSDYFPDPIHVYHDGVQWTVVNATMRPLAELTQMNVVAFRKPAPERRFGISSTNLTGAVNQALEPRWTTVSGDLRGIRSGYSDTPVLLTVRNERRDPITLSWVDYNGELIPYREIEPGGQIIQATFATHYWLMEGQQRQLYMVGDAPEQTAAYQYTEN